MQRRSSRCTNGSIGWVDRIPCLSVQAIIDDLINGSAEWNLYVCEERDIRHSFVVHRYGDRLDFYDYQGKSILIDEGFCTTIVYLTLKKDKSHGYKVGFGQVNEIEGGEYSFLCMKNSAFVMKYHCAPADKNFNSPYNCQFKKKEN